ncbi:hypothetical protein J7L97_02455, partial [Candidatus Bathyarchaeota archaeon]|nr:hypothetical protein [Candidatus Bathyarchaeota archaeon]
TIYANDEFYYEKMVELKKQLDSDEVLKFCVEIDPEPPIPIGKGMTRKELEKAVKKAFESSKD